MSTLKTELKSESPRETKKWLTNVSKLYETNMELLQKDLSNHEDSHERRLLEKNVHVSGLKTSSKYLDAEALQFLNSRKESREWFKNNAVEEMADIGRMKTFFKKVGITPIAILPRHLFYEIVRGQNLFIFKDITIDSTVKGKTFILPEPVKKPLLPFPSKGYLGWIAMYFLCFLSCAFVLWTNAQPVLSAALLSFVIMQMIATFLAEKKHIHRAYRYWNPLGSFFLARYEKTYKETKERREYFERLHDSAHAESLKSIKHLIWPARTDRTDDPWSKDHGKYVYKINLPTPPKDVERKLIKCHEHHIKTFVVVDEDAFTVDLNREVIADVALKYRPDPIPGKDPIVCYEWWGVVAIIDQFGDFAGEKAVMQQIKDRFTRLRDKMIEFEKN